jgi:hypothetical protein
MGKPMHTRVVMGMLVGATAVIAGIAQAAVPATPGPTPKPQVTIAPPQIRLTGVHAASKDPYTGGAFELAFDLENYGTTTATADLAMIGSGNALRTSASIPAKGKKTVTLGDPAGIPACNAAGYSLTSNFDTAKRNIVVTPSCTFKSTPSDPWNQLTPDHASELQKGNLYISNASIVTEPKCGVALSMNATLTNLTGKSSPSIVVAAANNKNVRAQTAAAIPVLAMAPTFAKLTPYGQPGDDPTEPLTVTILDWTKSLGGHVGNQGYQVTTARSCTVAVKLD